MTRLQLWKFQDNYNFHVNHTSTMRISGRSMDEAAILESLTAAKNDPHCTELDIHDVEFDLEEADAFIQVLRSSKRTWKIIRMGGCRGQSVSDVVMACMSGITDISLFHWQQLSSPMSAATAFAISYGLKYATPALRELSLAIHLTQDHATMLAKALARNVHLETLNMSGSVIDPAAVGSFGFAMRLNRTLKSLLLDGCHLDDKHVALIVHALLEHPSLKRLSLQQNSCHDEGMGAIAAMLHHDQLEELDLSYLIRKKKEAKPPSPPPEPEEEEKEEEKEKEPDETKKEAGDAADETKDEDGEESKEEATPASTSTTTSTSGKDQEVDDPDTQRVHNTSLKILQLAGNGLNDNFILSLLGIFGETSALQELNLFGNRISDRGVKMIVTKLSKLKRLRNLWLGHNPFSSFASMELVEAMRTNFVLEEVTIRTMDNDPGKDALQDTLDYYARLNRGGRKIFSAHEDTVPLALWPWVLERTSRIYWGGSTGNVLDEQDMAHSADSIYCLLRGPVLFSNPYLPSMATGTTTTTTTTASVGYGTEYNDIDNCGAAGDEDNADGGGWQTNAGTAKRERNRKKKKKGKRNFT
jgi:hypothetical protein